MSLKTLYITGVPGLVYIQHPELSYCEVMAVMREGKPLAETTNDFPTGREFKHVQSEGKIKLPLLLPVSEGPENNPAVEIDGANYPEKFIIEIKQP